MEHRTYGHISKGGPASVMQSAANQNERAGFITHQDVNAAANQGVSITDTDQTGNRMMTEPQWITVTLPQYRAAEVREPPVAPTLYLMALLLQLDASSKLPSDKAVTRKDAEGVIGAELRNDPNLCTHPGGVAASIAAAARLNQNRPCKEH
ncbi:hypothetical protein HAX54_038441 [Datura stramonium]|uniref:SMP domain-containing protein n=1 Tax=Datura stramonium TaxID=4076 RepID=A0ABS8VJT3_DATST|nr:hypothetical protein [Datura stramonium]